MNRDIIAKALAAPTESDVIKIAAGLPYREDIDSLAFQLAQEAVDGRTREVRYAKFLGTPLGVDLTRLKSTKPPMPVAQKFAKIAKAADARAGAVREPDEAGNPADTWLKLVDQHHKANPKLTRSQAIDAVMRSPEGRAAYNQQTTMAKMARLRGGGAAA